MPCNLVDEPVGSCDEPVGSCGTDGISTDNATDIEAVENDILGRSIYIYNIYVYIYTLYIYMVTPPKIYLSHFLMVFIYIYSYSRSKLA